MTRTCCFRILLTTVLLAAAPCRSADLGPATVTAFDHYVQLSEIRINQELNAGPFLWVDALPPDQRQDAIARLRRGDVLTRRLETLDHGHAIPVPGGLIHHWSAIVFLPGTTLKEALTVLQDYDHHSRFYAPEIVRSRLLDRNGNDFKIFYRLREKKIVTVVLDTEYDVHYVSLDPARSWSRSASTRIAQVQDAGEPGESEKPIGHDDGFMWRLNSYWHFWERDGGLYVQLEAISLTRDIPAALAWLIRPFITSIPQESLVFTLRRTREALVSPREAGAGAD